MSPAPDLIVLAHPLTERAELPVSPLVLAVGALYLLLTASAVAGRRWRTRTNAPAAPALRPLARDVVPTGPRRAIFGVTRAVGLALFVLAVVAGWIGDASQVRNITPALTLGAGWPLLTLVAIVAGRIWWWVNPYDTLARPLSGLGAGEGADLDEGVWPPVWGAVPFAALWMLYLTVWPDALAPRSIAWALVLYTLVTLAGCLALGRRVWLWRAELFTVFFDLLAAVRTRRTRWVPPDGAAALLGVVAGGALFGLFRDSDLGLFVAYGPRADLYSRIAVVVVMAAVGLAADRAARRATPGSVTVALVPATAALVVALAISRNRLTTSLQLLPILASNPLGGDLDLFGTRWRGFNTQPLGEVGPVWLQTGLLVIAHIAGVVLARRLVAEHSHPADMHGFPRTTGIILLLLGTLLTVGVASVAAI